MRVETHVEQFEVNVSSMLNLTLMFGMDVFVQIRRLDGLMEMQRKSFMLNFVVWH